MSGPSDASGGVPWVGLGYPVVPDVGRVLLAGCRAIPLIASELREHAFTGWTLGPQLRCHGSFLRADGKAPESLSHGTSCPRRRCRQVQSARRWCSVGRQCSPKVSLDSPTEPTAMTFCHGPVPLARTSHALSSSSTSRVTLPPMALWLLRKPVTTDPAKSTTIAPSGSGFGTAVSPLGFLLPTRDGPVLP